MTLHITSRMMEGVWWKVFSCLCFASTNAVIRYISVHGPSIGPEIPSYEMAFFQNAFGLLFLIPYITTRGLSSLKTTQPLLHFMRIATSALGVVLWYSALKYMPIAKAVALGFLGPLITAFGARWFLGERLGPLRLAAIIAGLVGGAVISHSSYIMGEASFADVTIAALFPLLSAVALSFSTLMTKKLTQKDPPYVIVTYLLFFMAPILLIPTLWTWVEPSMMQLGLFLLLGALSAGAHLSLTRAFQLADITFLVPFGFSRIIASAALGWMLFAEIPSQGTVIGSIIIGAAILILAYIGRVSTRHHMERGDVR